MQTASIDAVRGGLFALADKEQQPHKGKDGEGAKLNAEGCDVRPPECLAIESEATDDARSGHVDVNAVLVFFQAEIAQLQKRGDVSDINHERAHLVSLTSFTISAS
jgi:hypothetical protein